MKDLQRVSFTLQKGEVSAQTIEVRDWAGRFRFAWHFFKVALEFLAPWKRNPLRVTSTIIQGPISEPYRDGDLEKFCGIYPDMLYPDE